MLRIIRGSYSSIYVVYNGRVKKITYACGGVLVALLGVELEEYIEAKDTAEIRNIIKEESK